MDIEQIRKNMINRLECKLNEIKREDKIKYDDAVFELSDFIESWIKDIDLY